MSHSSDRHIRKEQAILQRVGDSLEALVHELEMITNNPSGPTIQDDVADAVGLLEHALEIIASAEMDGDATVGPIVPEF